MERHVDDATETPSRDQRNEKGPATRVALPRTIGRGRRSARSAVVTAAPLISAKDWLFAAALVAAVFLAYQPAWQGGFMWDDNQHVTRPELQSWHGLYRIWFDVGATQQYYPLLHSAFWVEHRLWGDATLGYHLVNILLHCLAALMVALVLRRLAIPGAFLAAAIFAPASGAGGIGGLDHRTEEHPLGRVLSRAPLWRTSGSTKRGRRDGISVGVGAVRGWPC